MNGLRGGAVTCPLLYPTLLPPACPEPCLLSLGGGADTPLCRCVPVGCPSANDTRLRERDLDLGSLRIPL